MQALPASEWPISAPVPLRLLTPRLSHPDVRAVQAKFKDIASSPTTRFAYDFFKLNAPAAGTTLRLRLYSPALNKFNWAIWEPGALPLGSTAEHAAPAIVVLHCGVDALLRWREAGAGLLSPRSSHLPHQSLTGCLLPLYAAAYNAPNVQGQWNAHRINVTSGSSDAASLIKGGGTGWWFRNDANLGEDTLVCYADSITKCPNQIVRSLAFWHDYYTTGALAKQDSKDFFADAIVLGVALMESNAGSTGYANNVEASGPATSNEEASVCSMAAPQRLPSRVLAVSAAGTHSSGVLMVAAALVPARLPALHSTGRSRLPLACPYRRLPTPASVLSGCSNCPHAPAVPCAPVSELPPSRSMSGRLPDQFTACLRACGSCFPTLGRSVPACLTCSSAAHPPPAACHSLYPCSYALLPQMRRPSATSLPVHWRRTSAPVASVSTLRTRACPASSAQVT